MHVPTSLLRGPILPSGAANGAERPNDRVIRFSQQSAYPSGDPSRGFAQIFYRSIYLRARIERRGLENPVAPAARTSAARVAAVCKVVYSLEPKQLGATDGEEG